MDAFTIVAGISLFVNVLFLFGSLIYTVRVSQTKGDHRLSTLGSVLEPRLSLQPQVTLYDAIVRLSGNPSLSQQQLAEKRDNQSIKAA